MVEGRISPADRRERTGRGIWKRPEQGEKAVNMASSLDRGGGWVREEMTKREGQGREGQEKKTIKRRNGRVIWE